MLVSMHGGFTKFRCFKCLWYSHSRAKHYIKYDWEPKKTYELRKDFVKHTPLISPMKTFVPPLYIKLRLIKYLVKAMAKTNSKGFQYLS
jgi:hypothetical protein